MTLHLKNKQILITFTNGKMTLLTLIVIFPLGSKNVVNHEKLTEGGKTNSSPCLPTFFSDKQNYNSDLTSRVVLEKESNFFK